MAQKWLLWTTLLLKHKNKNVLNVRKKPPARESKEKWQEVDSSIAQMNQKCAETLLKHKDKNCSNVRKKPQPEKAKKSDKKLIVPMHKRTEMCGNTAQAQK